MVTQTVNDYTKGFMAGIRPDPVLTVSEWADQHRILSRKASDEAGQWRTSRTPYLKKIMDALSVNSPYRRIVFVKGTQMGATETGLNWIGYSIHHVPGPMLAIQPTTETAKRWSKQRLAPMVADTHAIRELVKTPRERDSGNTVLCKEFLGGILIITGANSAVGLRSMPIEKLFGDEIDGYPADIEGEGDPISLAEKRTDNFPRRRKIFLTSTPTVKGFSRIEREFNDTDRQHYYVPCPFCYHFQPLEFKGLKWPKTKTGKHILDKIGYECESCKKIIPEYQKTKMLARGQWRPKPLTKSELEDLHMKERPVCQPDVIGFRLPGFYSPVGWVSWKKIAEEFIKAKRLRSRELFKTWVNTREAKSWEERGEKIDRNSIYSRTEKYGPEIPQGGILLTCGVDIHPDRIEAGVKAWGIGEESWGITHEIFYGPASEQDTWNRFDEFLKQEFFHVSGVPMKVVCTCIDSGNQTKYVYDFVSRRQARRIFATKGSSSAGRPVVSRPNKKSVTPVNVFPIGTDSAKDVIFGRLKLKESGPGYMHFPDNYEEEFFFQLTSEVAQKKYINGNPVKFYVQTRDRNEALDIEVLNLAALIILNADLEKVSENLRKKAEQIKAEKEKAKKGKNLEKKLNKPRRTGFVHRWNQ